MGGSCGLLVTVAMMLACSCAILSAASMVADAGDLFFRVLDIGLSVSFAPSVGAVVRRGFGAATGDTLGANARRRTNPVVGHEAARV